MSENFVDANTKELIIIYGTTHKPASSDTIPRSTKVELGIAGITMNAYKSHTWRSPSISKAKDTGVSITDIVKRGCWKSKNTFPKFCPKDILHK